jgi:hypothetical protein
MSLVLATALLVSGAFVGGVGLTGADAAEPATPMTGTVTCGFDGESTFRPWLGYGPGRGDGAINPAQDSKWKAFGVLSSCSGTQSGGHPKRPGPIGSGLLLMQAFANDHECQKVTDDGLTLTRLRVRWKDTLGRSLKTSVGSGHVSVDGLYNGWPYPDPFVPTPHPGYTAPGLITVTVTGTMDSTSRVFPGQTFSFTAVADQTISEMDLPCSFEGPPLRQGVSGFWFHGEHGSSLLSVS